jgi:cell division protein FtsN
MRFDPRSRGRSAAGFRPALVVAVVWAAAAGCSVQRVGVRDPAVRPGNYDPQAERASPPAPAVDPAAASGGESPPTLETPAPADFTAPGFEVQDITPAPAPSPPAASTPPAPPAGAGTAGAPAMFRVQVFAGGDAGQAERVRADVEARLGETARVVYQAPYYKVRVGACPSGEACATLQARLRAAGFTTTWVVADDDAR